MTPDAIPPLLTIAPTPRELGGLGSGNPHTRAGIVGIGHSAGTATAALLDDAPCRLLISLGFAGALDPNLHSGDIIVADAYLYGSSAALSGSPYATRAMMLLRQSRIHAVEGPILTVDEPLLTPQAKRRAHDASGALAVDMEGRWIANAAAARNVPLVEIRAVLDDAHFPLPAFVRAIVEDEGRHEWAHAVRAMSRPTAVKSVLPLALKSREAARALRTAVQSIIPALVPMSANADDGS